MLIERSPSDVGVTDGAAALRYISACDYDENADYPLFVQELSHLIHPQRIETVVDVGSGSGILASAILKLAPHARIAGIDGSDSMVKYSSDKYSASATFHKGFAEALPVASNSVDLVVSFNALHHLEALPPALNEMLRILKPGGIAYLSDLDRASPAKVVTRKLFRMNPKVKADFTQSMDSAFSAREIGDALTSVGCHSFSIRSAASIPHDLDFVRDPYHHDEDLDLYHRIFFKKLPC